MGVFEHFPYTNYHELNISWILRKLKELEEVIGTQIVDLVARAGVAENAQAISDLTDTVEANATTAHNEAAAAQSAAATAQSAANAAKSAADAAQSTADSALSAANTAQSGVNAINTALNNTSFTPVYITPDRGSVLEGGYLSVGHVVIVNFTFTALQTVSGTPSITASTPRSMTNCALSCIDVTSDASISSAVPAEIAKTGIIYVQNITTNHTYNISGVYVRQ